MKIKIDNLCFETIDAKAITKSPDGKFRYVYIIVNVKNGMFYIGKRTTRTMKEHYMGSGSEIRKAVRKNPFDFEKHILGVAYDDESLEDMELKFASEEVISRPNCYNLVRGGKPSGDWWKKKDKSELEPIISKKRESMKIWISSHPDDYKMKVEKQRNTQRLEVNRRAASKRMKDWISNNKEKFDSTLAKAIKSNRTIESRAKKSLVARAWISEHPEEHEENMSRIAKTRKTKKYRDEMSESVRVSYEKNPQLVEMRREAKSDWHKRNRWFSESRMKVVVVHLGEKTFRFRCIDEMAKWVMSEGLTQSKIITTVVRNIRRGISKKRIVYGVYASFEE